MTTLANIARRLNLSARPHAHLPPLILLTDERRLADPLPAVAKLPAGFGVLLRHYDDPRRRELAKALSAVCRSRHLRLLIAGDYRLALGVHADGLHLPAWMVRRLGPMAAPSAKPPGFLITAAAHTLKEASYAAEMGIDAIFLSPVFSTASHPGKRTLGPLRFSALSRHCAVPIYALGGINGVNARQLLGTPASGIAGISGIA